MGGQRNLIILAIAIALGVIAVVVANGYFSGMDERQAQIAKEQKLARIVVASQALAFGTKLTPDNLRMQNWPAGSVPQGAFASLDAALADNRVALRPIVPGEPVLADKVSGKDGRATLAANLAPGMRATSIPISNVTGVAGFVLPGTSVDVLLTRQIPGDGADQQDQMSDVILENVHVLAIDQLADEKTGDPKVGATATMETDLYGAQKLAVAQKIGTLSLVLRNIENQEPAALTTVTVRDLPGGQLYKRGRPQAIAQNAIPPILPQLFGALLPKAPANIPNAVSILPGGPMMSVYRGTAKSDYPVGTLGGR